MAMKGYFFALCLLLLPWGHLRAQQPAFAKAESTSMLEYYVLNDFDRAKSDTLFYLFFAPAGVRPAKLPALKQELDSLLHLLAASSRPGQEARLARRVFDRLGLRYLQQYHSPSLFSQTMQQGYFDCLTGTMLLAYAYDRLGYDYQIYETNSHAYLMLSLPNGGKVLVESTDGERGFVTAPESQRRRIARYEREAVAQPGQALIHEPLDLLTLAGLQYYNRAVLAYRQGAMRQAALDVRKAALFYGREEAHTRRLGQLQQHIAQETPQP